MKILGAGISGLTSAINLAKAGYKVKLYEKNKEIGDQIRQTAQALPNFIEDGNIIENLERCNIKINSTYPIKKAELFFNGKKIEIETKKPLGYTVLRGGSKSFEIYLKKQAEKEGVKVKTNMKKNIKTDIIATGPRNPLAIIYGRVYNGDFNPKKVKIFIDFGDCPGGYTYLYPHNKKRASFVIGSTSRNRLNLKRAIEKLYEKNKRYLNFDKSSFLYEFSRFADFRIPQTAVINNSIYVGESAGFQDPLAGFGMRYAIKSGFLAAKSIDKNVDYDYLWKREFLREMKKSLKIRKIVFNPFSEKYFKVFSKLFSNKRQN